MGGVDGGGENQARSGHEETAAGERRSAESMRTARTRRVSGDRCDADRSREGGEKLRNIALWRKST